MSYLTNLNNAILTLGPCRVDDCCKNHLQGEKNISSILAIFMECKYGHSTP